MAPFPLDLCTTNEPVRPASNTPCTTAKYIICMGIHTYPRHAPKHRALRGLSLCTPSVPNFMLPCLIPVCI